MSTSSRFGRLSRWLAPRRDRVGEAQVRQARAERLLASAESELAELRRDVDRIAPAGHAAVAGPQDAKGRTPR